VKLWMLEPILLICKERNTAACSSELCLVKTDAAEIQSSSEKFNSQVSENLRSWDIKITFNYCS